ncbi:MAG: SMP-30/gluconolactonase/LRE family protein, partial [Planctomycetota bacterium]
SAGNVYFTDQPNDRILRYDTTPGQANAKRMTVWMSPCGRSNGLFFANDQTLIACADEKNQLWSIPIVDGRPGPPVVLVDDYQEQLLNGPNDCWVSADGAIYFTDPFYKRPYWQRGPSQQDAACVYRYDPESKAVKRVADGFRQPNGIVGNPETGVVFIADIGDQKTYRFKIDREGNLTQRKLFCNSGSDGMTLDEKGNLYLTGNPGVMVFNAEGQRIDTIAVPQSWTANVTFGGPERKTLFVTAKSGLYAIETKFRGL